MKEKDELSLILRSHGLDLTSGIKQIMPVTELQKAISKKENDQFDEIYDFLEEFSKTMSRVRKIEYNSATI